MTVSSAPSSMPFGRTGAALVIVVIGAVIGWAAAWMIDWLPAPVGIFLGILTRDVAPDRNAVAGMSRAPASGSSAAPPSAGSSPPLGAAGGTFYLMGNHTIAERMYWHQPAVMLTRRCTS